MQPLTGATIVSGVGDGAAPPPGVPPAPGHICVLDHEVPWVRVGDELFREVSRLNAVVDELLEGPGAQDPNQLDGAERRALGVYAAAAWTLGEDDRAPMARAQILVSGHAIRDEIALADPRMRNRDPGWQYALGVLDWLFWITGATESLRYPGFAVDTAA
jgi:hypothetical protein